MATQFETAIMRLLIEQDMYKEGEGDTFMSPDKKWEFMIEKLDDNKWRISERNSSKPISTQVAEGEELSCMVREYIFRNHCISY